MAGQQIRDLVHTVKSTDLTGSQISQAFGEIYLSNDSISNQLESQEIVAQFQVVKVPTLGCSIPNSSKIVSAVGEGGIVPLFTPAANKTYQLIAADCVNGGAGNITVSFGYTNGGDFVTINSITVGSGSVGSFTTRNAYTFDSSVYPAVLITAGTAADLIVNMVYSELVQ